MSRRDDEERKRRERDRRLGMLAAAVLFAAGALLALGQIQAPRTDVVATAIGGERGIR